MHTPKCTSGESGCSHKPTTHYPPREEECEKCGEVKNLNFDSNNAQEKEWLGPIVKINEENATCIDLPSLTWHGYDRIPKILSVSNTGRTILINGQWSHGRPYIEGGPLNGSYIFSQIHFHCPSEHEINGRRYPLEMHVVHYKTSYLTQERAMYEKDGTVVFVYLFKVVETGRTVLSQVTQLGSSLSKVNNRVEMAKLSLDYLAKPFKSNYFVYWGSVTTEKNSYLLQWVINCNHLDVSKQEIEEMLTLMNCCGSFNTSRLPKIKPENDAIYRVGEEDYSLCVVKSKSIEKVCSPTREQSGDCYENPPFCKNKSKHSTNRRIFRRSTSSICEKEKSKADENKPSNPITTASESTNTSPVTSKNSMKQDKPRSSKSSGKITHGTQTEEVKHTENTEEVKRREPEKKRSKHEETEEKKAKEKKEKDEKKKKKKEKNKNENKSRDKSPRASKTSDEENATEPGVSSEKESESKPANEEYIQTLYEKDTKSKTKNRDSKDIQVNFLLTPNGVQSDLSNEVTATESESLTEVKDLIKEKSKEVIETPTETIVNTVLTPSIKLPDEKVKAQSKEICFHTEHLFRSEKAEKEMFDYQEYHVAIEYDHSILQEYKGMIKPYQLALGSFEKLHLVPQHEEVKDFHVQLKDCVVMMDSLHQIRVRAKFLIKKWGSEKAVFENGLDRDTDKSLIKFLDVGTQYTVDKLNINQEPSLQPLEKLFNTGFKFSPGSIERFNKEKPKENTPKDGCKVNCMGDKCEIKLVGNPETFRKESVEGAIINPIQQRSYTKEEEQREKNFASKSDKGLKCSLSKNKKTVYFTYDRIEKDVNTGKKIFVGSFRTKEEIKALAKRRNVFQNEESFTVFEKPQESDNEKKLKPDETEKKLCSGEIITNASDRRERGKEEKLFAFERQTGSESFQEEVVTLHEFKPKSSEKKSLLVGKFVSQLQKNQELARALGLDSKTKSNVSECAWHDSSETDGCISSSMNFDAGNKIKVNTLKGIMETNELTKEETEKFRKGVAERGCKGLQQKHSEKKESQATIIIIPIEVESLSKLELILIEHTGDVKDNKKEKEYIPCLNCYKRVLRANIFSSSLMTFIPLRGRLTMLMIKLNKTFLQVHAPKGQSEYPAFITRNKGCCTINNYRRP